MYQLYHTAKTLSRTICACTCIIYELPLWLTLYFPNLCISPYTRTQTLPVAPACHLCVSACGSLQATLYVLFAPVCGEICGSSDAKPLKNLAFLSDRQWISYELTPPYVFMGRHILQARAKQYRRCIQFQPYPIKLDMPNLSFYIIQVSPTLTP